MKDWFTLGEQAAQDLLTPALLFYSDRIDRNLHQMIAIAGDAVRLRPHVKTYKCRELVQRQLEAGICKFKCATLAELGNADAIAGAGYFIGLSTGWPGTGRFSTMVSSLFGSLVCID